MAVNPNADQFHAVINNMLDGSIDDTRDKTGHMDVAEATMIVKAAMTMLPRQQLESLAAAALVRLSRADAA